MYLSFLEESVCVRQPCRGDIVRYIYSCATCDGPVSKPAVSTDKEGKMVHGLGGWKLADQG
jgi:hypothetical protein